MVTTQTKTNGLEGVVLNKVNNYYLIPRKSCEVLDGNNQKPITTTPEVRENAARILRDNNIPVPESILTAFLEGKKVNLNTVDGVTAWNIYWAQEMAAAQIIIPGRGGSYERFLPSRLMHYESLANTIANLPNNGDKGIAEKKVLEAGSGSGLGLILLAMRGANSYGIDTSKIGILFSQYLTRHFAEVYHRDDVKSKVDVREGNYFKIEFPDGNFDVVYNSGVAEHLDERGLDTLITEMIRVTKPGGYVLISVPNEKGIFYTGYRQTKDRLKKQFPELIALPGDTGRHDHNIRSHMENHGLVGIKEDGLQVAPSTFIKSGDILPEDLRYFKMYLPPSEQPPTIEARIAAWRGLEAMTETSFRMRYGWTLYYVGQKPTELKPT